MDTSFKHNSMGAVMNIKKLKEFNLLKEEVEEVGW